MAMTNEQDLPEYEAMKRKTQQRFQAQGEQQQDALKRRYAAMGNLNSGSFVKQSQNVAEANTQQAEDAVQTVDTAQIAERRRMTELAEGRKFQTSEREAGQGFASGERAAGQGFASGEALKGREFAAGESAMMRALQEKGLSQQQAQQVIQNKLAQDQFDLDKSTTEWNKAQTEEEKGPAPKIPGTPGQVIKGVGYSNIITAPITLLGDLLNLW